MIINLVGKIKSHLISITIISSLIANTIYLFNDNSLKFPLEDTWSLNKLSDDIPKFRHSQLSIAFIDKNIEKNLTHAFLEAVLNQDIELVRFFIEKGIDVNVSDQKGFTPLTWAVLQGDLEIAKFLIESGANINAKNQEGWTALLWAANTGDLEIAKLLIEKGADINAKNEEGWTPLLGTANKGHTELAKLLIEKGADINARNQKGWTALIWAADKENGELTQLLIEKGADVNAINFEGSTAFIKACLNRNQPLANQLKKLGGLKNERWVMTKMLAHRFGLPIKVSVDGYPVQLEGLDSTLTYPELCHSLAQTFLSDSSALKLPAGWSKDDSQTVYDVIEQGAKYAFYTGTIREILKVRSAIDQGKIVAIPTGWKGHATGVVIAGDYLIKCNRGEKGQTSKPGLTIYKIEDKTQLNDVLGYLMQEQRKQTITFFEKEINEKLALREVSYFRHKDQHSGNCTWASAKLVFRAVLYAQLLKKGLSSEEANKISYRIYKRWTAEDRLVAVQDYVNMQASPNDPVSALKPLMLNFINKKIHRHLDQFNPLQSGVYAQMLNLIEGKNQI